MGAFTRILSYLGLSRGALRSTTRLCRLFPERICCHLVEFADSIQSSGYSSRHPALYGEKPITLNSNYAWDGICLRTKVSERLSCQVTFTESWPPRFSVSRNRKSLMPSAMTPREFLLELCMVAWPQRLQNKSGVLLILHNTTSTSFLRLRRSIVNGIFNSSDRHWQRVALRRRLAASGVGTSSRPRIVRTCSINPSTSRSRALPVTST